MVVHLAAMVVLLAGQTVVLLRTVASLLKQLSKVVTKKKLGSSCIRLLRAAGEKVEESSKTI